MTPVSGKDGLPSPGQIIAHAWFASDAPLTLEPGDRVNLVPADVPSGTCKCGCGSLTSIVKYADRSKGLVAGAPRDFRKGHQAVIGGPHFEVMPGGCWLWLRGGHPRGYGTLGPRLAHRVMYEAAGGTIPADLVLDHLCENKLCVNPAHLEVVTAKENLRRYHEGRDVA